MDNFIILVLGRKGSGKSYFVKQGLKNFNNLIIIDTLAEYEGVIIYDVQDFIDFIKSQPKNFQIVLRDLNDEKIDTYLSLLAELENITIVCEEVDYYFTGINPNMNLLKIIKYGRHKGINVVGISRRPFEVSPFLRSQADLVITFEQKEPRDIEALQKRFGKVDFNLGKYKYLAIGDTTLLKRYWKIDYKGEKEGKDTICSGKNEK